MKRKFSRHRRKQINHLLALIVLIGATLLQVTLAPFIKINGVHPNLVLLLVVGWIILRGFGEGVEWALIGGLCLDLMSGAPFGVFTLTMLLIALASGAVHGRLFGSSIVLPLTLTFPLSLLFDSLALLLLTLGGRPVVWTDAFFAVILPVAIFNTAIMLLVFPLLYILNRVLYPQKLSF